MNCSICGVENCPELSHQQLADFRGFNGALAPDHATLATGRPPNAADAPPTLPLRVDRWTVSVRHLSTTQVEAEVCVWARLPMSDDTGADSDTPHSCNPKRHKITGATRLEVLAQIFAYLASEGVS